VLSSSVLGLTALSWLLLVPAVLCWPVIGVAGYLVWRSAKRHGDADAAHRKALLERASQPVSGSGGSAE
jgi:hypothetical protein